MTQWSFRIETSSYKFQPFRFAQKWKEIKFCVKSLKYEWKISSIFSLLGKGKAKDCCIYAVFKNACFVSCEIVIRRWKL